MPTIVRLAFGLAVAFVANGHLAPESVATPAAGELWVARYNGPQSEFDIATAIAVSPDGARVYVTGASGQSHLAASGASDTGHDYATVAYDASGTQLWVRRYNGPGNGTDVAYAMAVSPDGARVYVTGKSVGSGTDYDYVTIAYDASGTRLWVRRYNGPRNGYDGASAIAVSPDGARVYVTGHSMGLGEGYAYTGYAYATVAYDANGTRLWVRRYNGPWRYGQPGTSADVADAIAVSPNGARVYVTGGSAGSGTDLDYATVAYDASGTQLWVRRYTRQMDSYDRASAIAVSPDGARLYVTGLSSAFGSSYDYATIAYDASGARLWVRRYNGPGNNWDEANAIAVSPDGARVYVTGSSQGWGTWFDYATIAYDASGTQLWVRRYADPEAQWYSDGANALAVSPDGTRVYVTGITVGPGPDFDYATIGYEASGMELWVRYYNGPADGRDGASAIAVGPDGARVYVTGTSHGWPSWDDYATIAYSAG